MGLALSKKPDPICQANSELLEAARSGDSESVERLLPHSGPDHRGCAKANVHFRHTGGLTALLAAAESGHAKVVQLLHKAGANHKAVDDRGRSALILASMNNHMAVAQLLLGLGVDVNYTYKAGRTALMEAATAGHVDSVEMLLKVGADSRLADSDGDTGLHLASANGLVLVVRELLEGDGCDVNARKNKGATPLILAAKDCHAEVVDALLQHGACVDAQDASGCSALIAASGKGHLAVVERLVEAGCDVHAVDCKGENALFKAFVGETSTPHMDVVRELLNKGIQSDSAVFYAADRMRRPGDGLSSLLQAGGNTNALNKEGTHILLWLLKESKQSDERVENAVETLVKAGSNVNVKGSGGVTTLMLAAAAGRQDLCKLLVEHGAEVDAPDDSACTALVLAAEAEAVRLRAEDMRKLKSLRNIVPLLVGLGSDPQYALARAAYRGDVQMAQLLLKEGASVNGRCSENDPKMAERSDKDWTPVMMAVSEGQVSFVRELKQLRPRINVGQGLNRMTCLILAAEKGDKAMVELLLEMGAKVDLSDDDGRTPIVAARRGGHEDIVDLLVKHGAKEEPHTNE